VSSIPVFVVAAFLEIAGCFAFWLAIAGAPVIIGFAPEGP